MSFKSLKTVVFILICLVFILGPSFIFARELEIQYPPLPFPGVETPNEFMEKIKRGDYSSELALSLYVKYFYYLLLTVIGLIAFGAIVYGGIQYLISFGSPAKVMAAREQIVGGFLGIVILLSSYLILTAINPDLAVFHLDREEIEKCDCSQEDLSDYCRAYCLEFEFPVPKKPVYLEIPTGRIIERIVLKSKNAKDIAKQTEAKAKELAKETEKLEKLLIECECYKRPFISKCHECAKWSEIRSMLDTICIEPDTNEEEVITSESFPYGCKYYYSNNPPDVPADCSCMETGTCIGEHSGAGCCPPHGFWGICGWDDCKPEERCGPGFVPSENSCPRSWFRGGSQSRPICRPGKIPRLIGELRSLRAQLVNAKYTLEREYLNLIIAERLLRDAASPPLHYEAFIAIDEKEIRKLMLWADIDIKEDPIKNIRDSLFSDLENILKKKILLENDGSNDPAVFYIAEKGNKEIIMLAEYELVPSGLPPPPNWQPPPDWEKPEKGALQWPLKQRRITQNYGCLTTKFAKSTYPCCCLDTDFSCENCPPGKLGGFHNGIDMVDDNNPEVLAAGNGIVFAKGASPIWGNWLIIYHQDLGISTLYAHLLGSDDCAHDTPETGTQIAAGTLIGCQGNTGQSFGTHLHFTVFFGQPNNQPPFGGISLNPYDYLP